MTKLAKGLRLDLSNSLARDVEQTADFLQGLLRPFAEAEAQAKNQLFTRRQ